MRALLLAAVVTLAFAACAAPAHRAMYYWKTAQGPSAAEIAVAEALGVERLYVRVFEVEADGIATPPLAEWAGAGNREIVPVVYAVLFSLTTQTEGNMLAEGTRSRQMRYRIYISADEDGVFTAECPSLPGCISEGATREIALQNIQDAIRGYLESLKKHGDAIPPSIDEEVVDWNAQHPS